MNFTFKKSDDEMDDLYTLDGTNVSIQVAPYAAHAYIVYDGLRYVNSFMTLRRAQTCARRIASVRA